MDVELSKGRKILFVVTIMLSALIPMADFVVIPIFPVWYGDFDGNMVNVATTGPLLMMAIGSVVVGSLCRLISKKWILAGSMLLFALASISTVAFYDIAWIIACRIVIGFTMGTSMVTCLSLIHISTRLASRT